MLGYRASLNFMVYQILVTLTDWGHYTYNIYDFYNTPDEGYAFVKWDYNERKREYETNLLRNYAGLNNIVDNLIYNVYEYSGSRYVLDYMLGNEITPPNLDRFENDIPPPTYNFII